MSTLSGLITPTNILTASNAETLTNKTIGFSTNTLTGVQPALVSGTSIKTVNSTSLLGSGDVAVQPTLVSGTSIKTINSTSLLGSGDVAVQPTLVSGTSIKTINSTSLLGSGDIAIPLTSPAGTTGQVQINNAGVFGAVSSGTSGQVLTSAGAGAAPTFATLSAGGMTLLSTTTIGSDSNYTITLPSSWWTGTYVYIMAIYNWSSVSGDAGGTYSGLYRIGGNSTADAYITRANYSTTAILQSSSSAMFAANASGGYLGTTVFMIFGTASSTTIQLSTMSPSSGAAGTYQTSVSSQTATSLDIYQPYFGSSRYRFTGPISVYGVK